MWNSIAWCFVDQCLLRNVNHESEYSWNIVISSVLYLLCSVTLQTTPDLRRTEKHFNRISGRQAFLLDCFQAMGDCFTVILIDKMPMEAFIRSWTFQAWRVFRPKFPGTTTIYYRSQSVSQRARQKVIIWRHIRSQWRPLGPLMIQWGWGWWPWQDCIQSDQTDCCKLPMTGIFFQ